MTASTSRWRSFLWPRCCRYGYNPPRACRLFPRFCTGCPRYGLSRAGTHSAAPWRRGPCQFRVPGTTPPSDASRDHQAPCDPRSAPARHAGYYRAQVRRDQMQMPTLQSPQGRPEESNSETATCDKPITRKHLAEIPRGCHRPRQASDRPLPAPPLGPCQTRS